MKNSFGFKILLPERNINLANTSSFISYLKNDSPFAGKIVYTEPGKESPFSLNMIIGIGPIVVPIKVIERDLYLHFDTVITALPETPATVLQTHMWNKSVTTALVYPFPMKQEDGTIAFTVSGGVPKAKVKKSFIDNFLTEFVQTCVFVMNSYYELGPEGPNNRSTKQPSWVAKLAKAEAEGPRASEFKLDKPEEPEANSGDEV